MSKRRALGASVAANLVNGLAAVGVSLLYVPIILDGVGLAAFGVWTLAQTAIIYVTTAESGIGPAVQRFVASAEGGADRDRVVRLLWSALALYTVLGALIAGLAWLAAPGFVDLFDVDEALRADGERMFRLVGVAMLLALLASGLGNVQQGLERFIAFAVTNAIGAVAFLAALIALLSSGESTLTDLGVAAIVQQAVLVVTRAVTVRDVFASGRPGLVTVHHAKEVVAFSFRLQMSVLSSLVNNQTDKVVIGLVAPTTTVGQAGIASQVGDASRLLAGAALGPMVSRMALIHGEGDTPGLVALFARVNRLWSIVVIGVTVIGAATIHPIIAGWLGDGYGTAATLGAFLVVAYGFNMLTGAGTSYLRAIGKPGLEARYGGLLILLNVALTPVLGIAAGATGVVAATAGAYAIGTGWFLWRLRQVAPEIRHEPWGEALVSVAAALVAGAASLGWGLLMIELLPPGFALAPVLLGAGVALVAYLAAVTRTAPTPAGLRALAGGYDRRP